MSRSADKIADRRARRSSRSHQSFALELDAELQALGDPRRFLLKYECIFRIENIVGRFSPQGKPAVEIALHEGADKQGVGHARVLGDLPAGVEAKDGLRPVPGRGE